MPTVGGKIIGKGSYGCVFDPPLLCKGETYIKSTSDLGKITKNSYATNELKIAAILRDVPLSSNYFIVPEAVACPIESIDKQVDPEIDKCDALKEIQFSKLIQFKLKYGGTALHRYLQNPDSYANFNFIDFCVHLLEGASLMALAGVVHYDIFEPNILMDDVTGVPRFIDWGFSFEGPKSTTERIDGNIPGWKTIYGKQSNTEPPEVSLANIVTHDKSVEYGIRYILTGKPIVNELNTFYLISLDQQKKEMEEFTKMSYAFKKQDWGAMFRENWPKFDSWSLGCLIHTIYLGLLQSRDFYKNTYTIIEERVNKMLKGMLQLNPYKRFDCLQALEILEPHNKILERFGKKWMAERKKIMSLPMTMYGRVPTAVAVPAGPAGPAGDALPRNPTAPAGPVRAPAS